MEPTSQDSDVDPREKLIGIIKERNKLREEMKLAKLAIYQLESQNIQLDQLITDLRSLPPLRDLGRPIIKPPLKSFIGPWECSPEEYPVLLPVEQLFRNGQRQQALNSLSSLLVCKDLDDRTYINAKLLCAALLQSTGLGSVIKRALAYAEEALSMCHEVRLHELAGKANYWRGLCYLCLEQWANARWCFILASNLPGHNDLIRDGRKIVEKELALLPEEKRSITDDFKLFCSAQMEDFILCSS